MALDSQLFFMDNPILEEKACKNAEWGTFKDSLRAPIHRWFTYPAGFSYKAVENAFQRYDINQGMTVYDPFMGSGTTNVTAKVHGINSYGIEAHPFVFDIAQSKMTWDIDKNLIQNFINDLSHNFENIYLRLINKNNFTLLEYFPELVCKCYSKNTLEKLLAIRNYFFSYPLGVSEKSFLFTAITALLRIISNVATGWPYIAPNKLKATSDNKDPIVELFSIISMMLEDIKKIKQVQTSSSTHNILLGSSSYISKEIPSESVDFLFTSPPYLNNFDYSDRTRLELYFWGHAKNWNDISKNIRSKLMTSATTQIVRSDEKYLLKKDFKKIDPAIYTFLDTAISELGEKRKIKAGKKCYDLMVAGYFNDMFDIIQECYRVLRKNSFALFILGDSAPYGVHIPTDKLIGELGCALGFNDYSLEILRKRGDKWKANPQRHNHPLQESIVILRKKR